MGATAHIRFIKPTFGFAVHAVEPQRLGQVQLVAIFLHPQRCTARIFHQKMFNLHARGLGHLGIAAVMVRQIFHDDFPGTGRQQIRRKGDVAVGTLFVIGGGDVGGKHPPLIGASRPEKSHQRDGQQATLGTAANIPDSFFHPGKFSA